MSRLRDLFEPPPPPAPVKARRVVDGKDVDERLCAKLKAETDAAVKAKLAAAQRAWRQQNRDKLAAAKRAYYQQNRDKVAAAQRAWRQQNRDKLAAAQRAYYQQNRDKVAAAQRAYYEANREKWKTVYAENRKRRLAESRQGHASGGRRSVRHALRGQG